MADEEVLKEVVSELSEQICGSFCKFSNTGTDGHCIWCQMHSDKCPLDELLEAVGLK